MIIEFPIIIAPRADLKGIQKGKLYGTMTTTTPISREVLTESRPERLQNN